MFSEFHTFLMDPCFWLSLIFGFTLLVLLHKHTKLDNWQKRGVDGPKPLNLFGYSLESIFKSSNDSECELIEKYGKVYGFYIRSTPSLSVSDPQLLKHIMVKDSRIFLNRAPCLSPNRVISKMLLLLRDEEWKRMRAVINPTFTSAKIKRMVPIIDGCVSNLLQHIELKANSEDEVDLKSLYGAYTTDVIASCAFATKINSHNNPKDPFIVNAHAFMNPNRFRVFMKLMLPTFVIDFIGFDLWPKSVTAFFENIVKLIIKTRAEQNVKSNDFLQLLLDADKKSSNLVNDTKDLNETQIGNQFNEEFENNAKLLTVDNKENQKLSEDEIVAQSLLFFVAGYDTTSYLLSYASYALAVNPDVQEKIYEEVKYLFEKDNEINYESLNKMVYMNAVINETLRHFPPITRVAREASRDYKLLDTDIIIPQGSLVSIPIYDIHHDQNNFPDPYCFKPERFLSESANDIKPYTFIPFGSGPRNCIAMRFALVEAKMALCNVVLGYKFVRSENTDVPLKLTYSWIPLLSAKRILVKIEKRI